ncbi:hypothetical protein [Nocardioides sp. WS12]|uniref:hypothetical protein n=1 Tax=Nocardioides sp. WS12 TaxID=2486272 RepID=UPI0015FA017A|nr:hypothetical protein [Nocardioides sp. WS12]
MPADDELPGEFTGPVEYADWWLWLAAALLVLLVAYYLVSWWVTRAPRVPTIARQDVDVPTAQEEHLARIDRVVAQVRAGALPPRDGHQQLSEVVRSYVATVTTLPARTMALADFRERAPQELVDAIEVMYPPEFAPDASLAEDAFDTAVTQARSLVGAWT